MSLTIYGIPASRAIRPLWAATELGLDFVHVPQAYQSGATRTPAFLALNPNGHIPVVNEVERDALTVLMHRLAMPPERRKADLAEAAERRLIAPLRVLERHLERQQAAGRAFLAADRFTVADLCTVSVVNWARPAKALMSDHPLTHDWITRCIARPAYQKAKNLGVLP